MDEIKTFKELLAMDLSYGFTKRVAEIKGFHEEWKRYDAIHTAITKTAKELYLKLEEKLQK